MRSNVFQFVNLDVIFPMQLHGFPFMSVCLFCVCVVRCVSSWLVTGWSPVKGDLPLECRIKKMKKRLRPCIRLYTHWKWNLTSGWPVKNALCLCIGLCNYQPVIVRILSEVTKRADVRLLGRKWEMFFFLLRILISRNDIGRGFWLL
jgi:hypothetical protein